MSDETDEIVLTVITFWKTNINKRFKSDSTIIDRYNAAIDEYINQFKAYEMLTTIC